MRKRRPDAGTLAQTRKVSRGHQQRPIIVSPYSPFPYLTRTSLERVDVGHDLGLEVRSSGIRNRADMAEAVRIGCNGMTINWPDWLIDHVAKQE